MKLGKVYSRTISDQIEKEIDYPAYLERLAASSNDFLEAISADGSAPRAARTERSKPIPGVSAEDFLEHCHEQLSHLEKYVIELCVNPALQFTAPGESAESVRRERVVLDESFPEMNRSDLRLPAKSPFATSELPCFKDVIGALFEYKRRFEDAARRNYVMTEVGKQLFETLDIGLATGKMVIVEGNSGIGKTTSAEAWCQQHLGEARFVSLSGITHKTGFFRALAKALGIGGSYARSSTEMQTRIEDMLQRSKLVLCIDEGHHLFSAAERVYSRPELVDWINTALYNHGVPVSLIVTPQFAIRMDRVEKQTTWNADQLRRRVKRFCALPGKPCTQDLEAVAKKLLTDANAAAVKYVVGYAISSKLNLPAIVDAVDMARLLAQRDGRDRITFEDVERAVTQYCAISSEAMARSFTTRPAKPRGRRPAPALMDAPHGDGSGAADTLSLAPERRGRKTNLTGLAPVRSGTSPVVALTHREANLNAA